MAELRESHKEKVAAVREAGDAALSRAVQSASQQMAELQRAHALELERTRMEWEAHTAELTKRHGEEISRLKGMVEVAETVRASPAPPHLLLLLLLFPFSVPPPFPTQSRLTLFISHLHPPHPSSPPYSVPCQGP